MEPIILSDEDDPSTPFPVHSKKRRTGPDPNPATVYIVVDDPTPQKQPPPPPPSSSTPSIVAETPMSPLLDSDVAIVKCTRRTSDTSARVSPSATGKFSGRLIFSHCATTSLYTLLHCAYFSLSMLCFAKLLFDSLSVTIFLLEGTLTLLVRR